MDILNTVSLKYNNQIEINIDGGELFSGIIQDKLYIWYEFKLHLLQILL